jgi:hypothetical protein
MRDGLEQFGGFLQENLSNRIRARARADAPGLESWLAAENRVAQLFARSGSLNLEPRQTLLAAARDMAGAARRSAL